MSDHAHSPAGNTRHSRLGGLLHRAVHRREDAQTFNAPGSETYDRHTRRSLRGLYRRVAREAAAAAPADGAVLDVGTGPGRLLHALAAQRADLALTGVDVAPDMTALARRLAGEAGLGGRLDFRTGDVAVLPCEDASADLVVSTLSMHHWPDLPAAARELARVLRPGGHLLIVDFRFAPLRAGLEALRAQPAFAHGRAVRSPVRGGLPLFARVQAWTPSA
ncbi:class I SAM-dependent methyltransferase [Streptomyces sp. DSM 44917]|uniref:Class I SAM-dependent methyltransferase n=1 Tax=Streptomyces boetiae TaxID=3075541 RepID=A0ABU2L235_9ACTN|nr:class I SAM-dependent methyltransferase [Streptomyces sp. DSM 44917]MDT0305452.1 class I SAM-dependent methyltransferase [Streptomyces sp. DSM 44917]